MCADVRQDSGVFLSARRGRNAQFSEEGLSECVGDLVEVVSGEVNNLSTMYMLSGYTIYTVYIFLLFNLVSEYNIHECDNVK